MLHVRTYKKACKFLTFDADTIFYITTENNTESWRNTRSRWLRSGFQADLTKGILHPMVLQVVGVIGFKISFIKSVLGARKPDMPWRLGYVFSAICLPQSRIAQNLQT